MASEALVQVRDLAKHFPYQRGAFGSSRTMLRAVDGVSFAIRKGETLAVVGESGCGKSTLGRLLLRLIEPTAGEVRFEDKDVLALGPEALRALRRDMQIVFQDPYASLNPRLPVIDLIAEPLITHRQLSRAEVERVVADLMTRVGLRPAYMRRYPHQFSGGQRQRIGIARALALHPKLIVCCRTRTGGTGRDRFSRGMCRARSIRRRGAGFARGARWRCRGALRWSRS